jgi:hypothetical protein
MRIIMNLKKEMDFGILYLFYYEIEFRDAALERGMCNLLSLR